ncbi:MAG: cyclic nucleotide-binding domain-containing protein, partial [Nocardioides sp.]
MSARTWLMAEADIFADLPHDEAELMSSAVPRRTFEAGSLIHTPHHPVEALYILKRGRVRTFRTASDGRRLT